MAIEESEAEFHGLDEGNAHALLFHALSEPTRLAILQHLATGEHRVRDLVEHMHLAQSTVSKHLACLRDCGLVNHRAEGRSSWFSLAHPELLAALLGNSAALLAASGRTLSLGEHELRAAMLTKDEP
ncbi:metalloregulator ArsR/SmtB family transcription factor [Tessaracoccus sp. OH4464_COT-324]|uniref:ArsR/SmtB family transcription factor n=1 Tax=Tessaracoccus sp. OH4464_COT-324 TaxID=2491059 RepID=UPI000F63039E|nr:metalloregulator ArsR/SmtB family transcription factor [Tessaracoccus sp. OH4464_COT-324]RRD46513.1 ArsR family transcriptional regulator [Tessaracoccus sp. OH4464_COT-324]